MKNKEIKSIKDLYPTDYLNNLSIIELDGLTEEIYNCIHDINEIRDKKETEEFKINDYVNKFLAVEDKHRGLYYIHVQNQWHSIRNGEGELILEGQAFRSSFNPSPEYTYLHYDQWEQIEVSIDKINTSIDVISKEEFIEQYNKVITSITEQFNEIVEHGNKNRLYEKNK